MQKPCEKTCKLFVSCKKCCSCHAKKRASCSTCHAKTQAVPRVKKTSCSTCKNRAKPCKKPTCQNDMSLCSCKNHAKPCNMRLRTERQPAEPSLSPGSLLYVLYVLYLTRQATEHPLSPGSSVLPASRVASRIWGRTRPPFLPSGWAGPTPGSAPRSAASPLRWRHGEVHLGCAPRPRLPRSCRTMGRRRCRPGHVTTKLEAVPGVKL